MNPSKIRERKCSTCKHYQPSPLWRKGWCRNPLLYDRNTNHLVEADSLACNRTFIDYWEPITGPTPMAPVGPSGRATPKPRIAPSIPMEMTDARGERVTRTGITPMNGMTTVTADDFEDELAVEDLPYAKVQTYEPEQNEVETAQSTLELEQIEAAARTANGNARNATGTNKTTTGLTKAQQRAQAATAAKENNKKAKATRPPQRPILLGMGRDRLILIGVIILLLVAAAVAAALFITKQPSKGVIVTPTATARPIPSPTGFGDPTQTPVPQPTDTAVAVVVPPADVIGVNGWVQVTANVRLRSQASTSGTVLGTLKQGTNGHVIEGPVDANGYTWWKIDSYDGTDPTASGWCAGEFLKPIPAP